MLNYILNDSNRDRLTHRDIGFFKEKNIDRTLISLRKIVGNYDNEKLINENMPVIYLNDENKLNKPNVHHRRSITFSTKFFNDSNQYSNTEKFNETNNLYRSMSNSSVTVNKKEEVSLKNKPEKLDSETKFLYNKIFAKNIAKNEKITPNIKFNKPIIFEKKDPNKIRLEDRVNNTQKKIKELKTKVLFIKSVYDYSYPSVIVEKLKQMKEIIKRSELKRKLKFEKNQQEKDIKEEEYLINKFNKSKSPIRLVNQIKLPSSLYNSPEKKNTSINGFSYAKKVSRATSMLSSNFSTPASTTLGYSINRSPNISVFNKK